MPSEQVPPQSTQNQSQLPPGLSSPAPIVARADEITRSLQGSDSESPLDFIKKNLRPTVNPDEPKPETLEPAKIPDKPVTEYNLNPKKEDLKKDESTGIETLGIGDGKIGDEVSETFDEDSNPIAENFKKLRTKLKETSTTLRSTIEENEKTKKELEKYRTGEVVPEMLQEKENEIARLSTFEKLHNLKMSKAYQEKYIKPLTENRNKLSEIAKDYGIPEERTKEFIDTALNLTNRADRNRFLSEHFDEVGALEVKDILNKISETELGARAAENEPAKMLEELEHEHQKILEQKSKEKIHYIKEKSQNAWVKSLLNIREEGVMEELIYKENDPEHNERWATPIVTKAAQEYGKIVTMLAECGLESLPDDLAYALARMSQLAHASAASAYTRTAALKHATEIEENTKRTNGYMRPSIGSPGSGGGGVEARKPSSPLEAADVLLNSVLRTR